MAEEYSFQFAEYAHPVKAQGKILQKRILFFCAIAIFSIAYCVLFTAVITIPQVIALLPIFLYIAFLAVWRYLSYDCVTRIESGTLAFLHENGKRKKQLYSCRVKELVFLAEDTSESREYIEKEYRLPIVSYSSEAEVPKRCIAVAKTEETRVAFVFDANTEVERVIRYYNRSLFDQQPLSH